MEAGAGAVIDSPGCQGADQLVGLSARWMFDEGSGLVVHDSTGGASGTLVNGPTWVAGRRGTDHAIQFDGIDDQVDISGTSVFATTTAAFSFSAWVNLLNYSADTPDIMMIRSDGATPWHVLFSSETAYLGVSVGSAEDFVPIRTNQLPSTGTWHHVAATFDGVDATAVSSFAIYLDGVAQDTEMADGYGTQAQNSRIGAAEVSANQWTGAIEDVRLYGRMLSPAEVGSIFVACP